MRRVATRLHATLASLLLSLGIPAQDEAGFDQGYAAVRALMQKGKWFEARAALMAMLEGNKGKDYVRAQREGIVADHRLCSFWCETAVPQPEQLLSGKIESYSAASGKIRIRYTPATMQDWECSPDKVYVHPVVFAGSYTVTIIDDAYPGQNNSLRVLVDIDDDSACVVDFGFPPQDQGRSQVWLPVAIEYHNGDKDEQLATHEISLAKPGKPFQAVVRVDKNSIEASFDKQKMLKGKRPACSGGQVGLIGIRFKEVVLEGEIEPSWFQNRVDQALAQKRAGFTRGYVAEKVLPAWLFTRPETPRTGVKHVFRGDPSRSPRAGEFYSAMDRSDLPRCLVLLDKLGDDDMPAADRQYLRGLLLCRRGDGEAALAPVQAALAACPEATHVRVLQAEVFELLRRRQEALPLLQAAVADDPGNGEAVEALFVALLRRGDMAAAERLLRDARCKHGMWDETAALDQMLAMRQRGPEWPARYSYKSTNYEVSSDIDVKVCTTACRILEESYVNLKGQLAWVKDDKDAPRFHVYLFAGESGYQDYVHRILGEPMPHTAGLFSPLLQQLLIWNVPRREEMERTIRHEGFHQFLDRAMQDPPVWFNEGMAEFWETARRENGRLTGGQLHPTYPPLLRQQRNVLPKLKEFVHGSAADFYANADLRYPQAWALVHFLRKGPPANQRLFQALWEALRGDGSTNAAVDKAFAGVDWAKFEDGYWNWIEKLSTAK